MVANAFVFEASKKELQISIKGANCIKTMCRTINFEKVEHCQTVKTERVITVVEKHMF